MLPGSGAFFPKGFSGGGRMGENSTTDSDQSLTCFTKPLAFPHCQARLEGRNPRLIGLLCFFLAVIVPGHLGHQFVLIADILMVAIFLLALREMMRPNLRLRKDHPKPENKLNIND